MSKERTTDVRSSVLFFDMVPSLFQKRVSISTVGCLSVRFGHGRVTIDLKAADFWLLLVFNNPISFQLVDVALCQVFVSPVQPSSRSHFEVTLYKINHRPTNRSAKHESSKFWKDDMKRVRIHYQMISTIFFKDNIYIVYLNSIYNVYIYVYT
jgi:hypothetical protein